MSLINLTKTAQITLEKKGILSEKVQVILALDYSYSMRSLYEKGVVDNIVKELLAIGLNIDIDQSIEVYTFGKNPRHIGQVTQDNHENFVANHIRTQEYESSTFYANILNLIAQDAGTSTIEHVDYVEKASTKLFGRLFGKTTTEKVVTTMPNPNPPKVPTLVFFLTDGDCFDENLSREAIRITSTQPIFWQFVGIGDTSFRFLSELDENVKGRSVDNANFFQLNDIAHVSPSELYDRILNEFPQWLIESRKLGITPPQN